MYIQVSHTEKGLECTCNSISAVSMFVPSFFQMTVHFYNVKFVKTMWYILMSIFSARVTRTVFSSVRRPLSLEVRVNN